MLPHGLGAASCRSDEVVTLLNREGREMLAMTVPPVAGDASRVRLSDRDLASDQRRHHGMPGLMVSNARTLYRVDPVEPSDQIIELRDICRRERVPGVATRLENRGPKTYLGPQLVELGQALR